MLRRAPAAAVAVAVLAAVAVLVPAAAARAADLEDVQKQGLLKVVVWSDNLPELFAVGKGAASGLEQELLEGFANLHKVRIQVVAVPGLDDRLPALLKGEGDLVAGGLVNTESRR